MRQLTIYFTSDTHGFLYNTGFVDASPQPMGLLGMRFPKDGNTLIIDGGDTIQGSPLTYFCHDTGEPLPVAPAMNDRGYDYVTLGNHDFNYGPAWLRDYLTRLNAVCLCANVADEAHGLSILPHTVHTLENGLRVGLIGLVTSWINLWEKQENLSGLTISDTLAAARRSWQALQGQYDVLVGIYHGGLERNLETGALLSSSDENIGCRLCEEIPFDLLLTGHQHIAMENRSWHGTHIVQPPCNATSYICVEMDDQRRFTSRLCPVPAEHVLTEAETILREKMDRWLDTPIGHLPRDLWPAGKLEMALHGSPIADFFNQVQLWATGADISCTSLPNELRGFSRSVTVRDVVASYVYANTLITLRVTGRVLRQALEQCARYFDVHPDGTVGIAAPFLQPKEAHFNYDYFAGIAYTFDLSRPAGERVTRLEREGRPICDAEEFTLCLSNYRATGAGDFDCYLPCPRLREGQTEVRDLLLDYIRLHPDIQLSPGPAFTVQRGDEVL